MSGKAGEEEEIFPSKELLGLDRIKVGIDHVFLDPNNPRFGLDRHIDDDRITEEDIQKKMVERVEEVGIDDLTLTMSRYGFSPTDPIVVRKFGSSEYVVIEGNRRLTAMKSLLASHKSGDLILDKDILASIESFDVLVYKGRDPDIAWIIQGLRHMSGIVNWPPLQQATFLSKIEQRLKARAKKKKGHPPGIPSVARTASVKPGEAKKLIWSYHAYKQARADEDYGDKLDQRRFSMFSGVIFAE